MLEIGMAAMAPFKDEQEEKVQEVETAALMSAPWIGVVGTSVPAGDAPICILLVLDTKLNTTSHKYST